MYSARRLWVSSRRSTVYHLDDGFRGFTSRSAENSYKALFWAPALVASILSAHVYANGGMLPQAVDRPG
jgi:hypothetical protein